jgi:hypothetical protein
VWVGELVPRISQQETYHQTRSSAIKHVTDVLVDHSRQEHKVLVGFDFPYGYPAGFTRALALPHGPQSWWAVWAELADRVQDNHSNNVSNRFAAAGELNTIAANGNQGPFWGCPVGTMIAALQPRDPGFPFQAAGNVPLLRYRIVEERLREEHFRVQEAWKLYGAGSVGSQALVGIPYVYGLRRHPELVQISRVWPFEVQFTSVPSPGRGPFVLHAEIWPGVVKQRVDVLMSGGAGLIRDRAQVRAMCEWVAERDEQDMLGQFFDTPVGLSQQQIHVCVEEEGWILGAQ